MVERRQERLVINVQLLSYNRDKVLNMGSMDELRGIHGSFEIV